MKYRVDIFGGMSDGICYFDDEMDAVIFGARINDARSVFLLKAAYLSDDGTQYYSVVREIK